MRFKPFTRSLAALSSSLLLMLAASARPAFAQPGAAASLDSVTPISKLAVGPRSIGFGINLDKVTSQTKHFTLINTGTLPLDVTVGAPTGVDANDYTISGPGLTGAGGTITIPGKVAHSTANKVAVNVTFAPPAAGIKLLATIPITDDATIGITSATINLHGHAIQPKPTPTATPTSTATATATPTTVPTAMGATPTATATSTATPDPSATATVTATATTTATTTATSSATGTATTTATALRRLPRPKQLRRPLPRPRLPRRPLLRLQPPPRR